MAILKTIARAVGYPIAGAIIGLTTGLSLGLSYISYRIIKKLPGSEPNVSVVIETANVSLQKLLECLEEHRDNCIDVHTEIDSSSLAWPILIGTASMAGAGLVAGIGYCAYKERSRRRNPFISLNVDSDPFHEGYSSSRSSFLDC